MLIILPQFSPELQGPKCSTIKIILVPWFTIENVSLFNTKTEAFGAFFFPIQHTLSEFIVRYHNYNGSYSIR